MEDSVPTRKRCRPRKIPSIDADHLRSITGVCRCGTLMQVKQGPRSVREYTEEFLETAKRCKPKSAEDWCRWNKAELREEIQGKLLGVLEPCEFALVNRMAGQAMEAKRAPTVGSLPSRALRRKWKWKRICGRHRLWMKEPREDIPSRASARLRRDIRGELNGAMKSMEFSLVVRMAGLKPEDWNSGRIPINRGRIVTPQNPSSESFCDLKGKAHPAAHCDENPRVSFPFPINTKPPPSFSHQKFQRSSAEIPEDKKILAVKTFFLSLFAVSTREWWWWPCGVVDLISHLSCLLFQIQI
ncbi:hypothetical protein F2Q70_00029262 [Brassica cretica]|uniref:Retrotransposon gag domain-containing protein n=1 Tax=Brassica cretica TaxID=69181 RepID=A0A8S9FEB3_BRACR|nr:hypothetical protein F2Q70_00029262 [Brassica cretica]